MKLICFIVLFSFGSSLNLNAQEWQSLNNVQFSAGGGGISTFLNWGDSLVLGGTFTAVNDSSSLGLVIWDNDIFHPVPAGSIAHDLAIYDGFVVVGSSQFNWDVFDQYTGAAYWDFENWYEMDGGAHWPTGDVQDLVVYDTLLIATGGFDEIGSIEDANQVAAWNGEEWLDIGGIVPGAGAGVLCSEVYNGELYIGGGFAGTTDPEQSVYGISRWDGITWYPVGEGVGMGGGYIKDLMTDTVNNVLYASGWFYQENSGAFGVTKWDGENWEAITDFGGSLNSDVISMGMYRGQLYCGGFFSSTQDGDQVIENVARFDGVEWQPVGDGLGSDSQAVFDFTVYHDELYACGSFTYSGNTELSKVARYYLHPDSVTWGVPDTTIDIVEQEIIDSSIRLYPNPNDGQFYVELDATSVTSGSILITDMNGRQEYYEALQGRHKLNIDISHLSAGVYLCSWVDGGALTETVRFIVE